VVVAMVVAGWQHGEEVGHAWHMANARNSGEIVGRGFWRLKDRLGNTGGDGKRRWRGALMTHWKLKFKWDCWGGLCYFLTNLIVDGFIDILKLSDPELSQDFGDSFSDLSQYVLHYPDCPLLGPITNLKSLFITTFYVFCCH
jgi:hypothetical protein